MSGVGTGFSRITGAGMSRGRAVLVGLAAAVLAGCLLASYLTRGAMENLAFVDGQGAGGGLVDQRPWQTAAALAPQAVTAEEKALALQAERLADHEVDQAFAMALRQAEMETHVLTGPALAMQQKLNDLADLVNDDQDRVDGLTGMLAEATKKGSASAQSLSDDLDAAKSQMQLDSDEMGDVSDDLARERGDKRSADSAGTDGARRLDEEVRRPVERRRGSRDFGEAI